MGGHGTLRTEPAYAAIADLARILSRAGLMIVTGGGPGLMEAANLGAFLGPYGDAEFKDALSTLRTVPNSSAANAHDWLRTAAEVERPLSSRRRLEIPAKAQSANLGIPTWLYGFEPPNMFATVIGKYFYNSVREDGLVTIASGGLIFGKGEAGTVQEVFQDATLNYYRSDYTPTPMVFLGKDFWHPAKYDGSTPSTRSVAKAGLPSPAVDAIPKPIKRLATSQAVASGYVRPKTRTKRRARLCCRFFFREEFPN